MIDPLFPDTNYPSLKSFDHSLERFRTDRMMVEGINKREKKERGMKHGKEEKGSDSKDENY